MININLNAMEEWERVRRNTEPHTSDVDRNPGTENPDRPELEDGSHGLTVKPRRRRKGDASANDDTPDTGKTDAYEVDIGEDDDRFAVPEGPRAPIEPYQGQNVDEEA